MRVVQTAVFGENFVGLIGLATDAYAILCPGFKKVDGLDVPVLHTKAYGTNLTGMFLAGNSNGLLLPYFVKENELARIRKFAKEVGFEVGTLGGRHTALGNLISANDKAALISEDIRESKAIADILGVEAVPFSVDGRSEIGAYVAATNRGFLAHPDAAERLKDIEDVLGVAGGVGTVNCGVQFVKSGIIANSTGYITGSRTTGIELSQIDEALGFLD